VLLILGAVLITVFSWYLSGTPRFKEIGPLLPFLQVGAALAGQGIQTINSPRVDFFCKKFLAGTQLY
jgi:hypothetical protein